MSVAWIPLSCTGCDKEWEGEPASLPAPGNEFECPYCGNRRPVAEFVKTKEGLTVLEEFHG